MSLRRTTFSKPRQVVVIGHNAQVVPTVGLFVGAEVSVQVFTCGAMIEEQLAPYPAVEVHLVDGSYREMPLDLADGPFFVCVDSDDTAKAIRSWLPRTMGVFLMRNSHKKGARLPPGFLKLPNSRRQHLRQLFWRIGTVRRVDQLMDLARNTELPLILMYSDPDPDAIGSALALATIWRAAGARPIIRYTGEVQRYQNKLLVSYLKDPIERLRESERLGADLVAVVDAQPGFWREHPPHAHVVIDHHPRRPDAQAAFTDIRTDYGSTSTILTEYLVEADISINQQLATALLYGLKTDTNDLQRNASARDIKAFDLLHDRADQHFIARLSRSQVPMNMLDFISWGISNRIVYRDMMLVHFGEVPSPDVLVQSADLLLLTCGINWVVCAGKHEDKLVSVFRGDGHRQDVGGRAKSAFGKIGSAGGHRTMGRAEVPLHGQHVDVSVDLLIDNLFKRLSEERRRKIKRTLRNILHGPGVSGPVFAEKI
jgi:nanoRNase/pAp phosphatase (c-di-AMP/oligoRNAs hydrolase)